MALAAACGGLHERDCAPARGYGHAAREGRAGWCGDRTAEARPIDARHSLSVCPQAPRALRITARKRAPDPSLGFPCHVVIWVLFLRIAGLSLRLKLRCWRSPRKHGRRAFAS